MLLQKRIRRALAPINKKPLKNLNTLFKLNPYAETAGKMFPMVMRQSMEATKPVKGNKVSY